MITFYKRGSDSRLIQALALEPTALINPAQIEATPSFDQEMAPILISPATDIKRGSIQPQQFDFTTLGKLSFPRQISTIDNLDSGSFDGKAFDSPLQMLDPNDDTGLQKSFRGVVNMPIKLPGMTALTLPTELSQFKQSLQKIINDAVQAQDYVEQYVYLTIDQGIIKPNEGQRQEGWHVDGMQGYERMRTVTKNQLEEIGIDVLDAQFSKLIIDLGDDIWGIPSFTELFEQTTPKIDPSLQKVLMQWSKGEYPEKNYVVSTNPHLATLFAQRDVKGLPMNIDGIPDRRFDVSKEFSAQLPEDLDNTDQIFQSAAGIIYALDANCVHAVKTNTTGLDQERTFMRVTFSRIPFVKYGYADNCHLQDHPLYPERVNMKYPILLDGPLHRGIKPTLSTQYEDCFIQLQEETKEHKSYLATIGLAERAKGIKVDWHVSETDLSSIDLTPYHQRISIPEEVEGFDVSAKNTVITTKKELEFNDPKDIETILAIRLYPTLRNLILNHGVEVFLGSKKELDAYYQGQNANLLFQFKLPTSAKYYLAVNHEGKFFVVMAGLVSRENLIAQLATLKLANIEKDKIEIIGDCENFSRRCHNDLYQFTNTVTVNESGENILILAGCGLEEKVVTTIKETCKIKDTKQFSGDITSLTYLETSDSEDYNNVTGFFVLNLNYGEICEEQISYLLENYRCKAIFTGSAGGFIPTDNNAYRPEIGTRLRIIESMNYNGEVTTVQAQLNQGEEVLGLHLQVPTIFFESYTWLYNAKQLPASSVDVETFYAMRATQTYNKNHSVPVEGNFGCFISDYIGEKPLRAYNGVFDKYREILSSFIHNIIETGKTSKLSTENTPLSSCSIFQPPTNTLNNSVPLISDGASFINYSS